MGEPVVNILVHTLDENKADAKISFGGRSRYPVELREITTLEELLEACEGSCYLENHEDGLFVMHDFSYIELY